MAVVAEAAPRLGTAPACEALGVPRASYYRSLKPAIVRAPRPPSARALGPAERSQVLDHLHSERFVDSAPIEIWATLLDEGVHLCSTRTMYRILEAEGENQPRRQRERRLHYPKPELLATAPNQLWSWDITKLHGPAKWTYFYLYVLLDVFSRYVVGWLLAHEESAVLAQGLISEAYRKENVQPGQLVVHADRGSSMTSHPVAFLLANLGVTKSHSRPYVSNDNPYSESHFKTLKYRPDFPKRFGSIEDGTSHCRAFFRWYNFEHRHSSLGLMTPALIHTGGAQLVRDARAEALLKAYQAHPERFVRKAPQPPTLPQAAWINRPMTDRENQAGSTQ
jgi:putative transposase